MNGAVSRVIIVVLCVLFPLLAKADFKPLDYGPFAAPAPEKTESFNIISVLYGDVAGIFGPSNYSECILDEMPGTLNDVTAFAVRKYCREKYPSDVAEKKNEWTLWGIKTSQECVIKYAKETTSSKAAIFIRRACRNLYPKQQVKPTGNYFDKFDKNQTTSERYLTDEELYGPAPSGSLSMYTVGGQFQAMFPGKPEFMGEMKGGVFQFNGYIFGDKENSISYIAGYQTNEVRYRESDVREAIKNFIMGNAIALDGTVSKLITKKLSGGLYRGDYTMKFKYQKIEARKTGRVFYKNGHFYFWAVQDFPAVSKLEGPSIFKKYVGDFQLIQ